MYSIYYWELVYMYVRTICTAGTICDFLPIPQSGRYSGSDLVNKKSRQNRKYNPKLKLHLSSSQLFNPEVDLNKYISPRVQIYKQFSTQRPCR